MTYESPDFDHFNEIVAPNEKSKDEKDAAELYEMTANAAFVKNVLLDAVNQARELSQHTPVDGIVNVAKSQYNEVDRQLTYQRFRVEPGKDVDQDKYFITDATVVYDEVATGTEDSTEYVLNAATMELEACIKKTRIEPGLIKRELERIDNPAGELADNKDADREDIERILEGLKLHSRAQSA